MIRNFRVLLGLLLVLAALSAKAQLNIEITGAGANRIPVAIANFLGEGSGAQALTPVIRADLERSGLFDLIDAGAGPIGELTPVDFADWKARSADAVVVGSVLPASAGRTTVQFRLYDVVKQSALAEQALPVGSTGMRRAAHRIADIIYEKLTGEPGVFSTRIAYVVKNGGRHQLQIADADGMNPQTALASSEPIGSPSWSPDGNRLAYVSWERKKPIIYVQNLAKGQRTVVANFKGSNSAPAWSPDGNRLAVVLTKDGGSQIYVINADGTGVRRIAQSSGIDTEPVFSSDGQTIYFTSDRGGSPQIYRVSAAGGGAERVTFEGSYNATPRISPDGKSLAFLTRNSGRFQVATMDLASRQVQILTDSSQDESLSYAPNGRMVLYATQSGGRSVLAAVSTDGRVKQKITVQAGEVLHPTWGPLPKN